MTNPLPNHLHIQRQIECCPGASLQGRDYANAQGLPFRQEGDFTDVE